MNSIAEVSLPRLLHNFRILESLLKPGVRVMCVVKADAYGHGSVPVARTLEPVTDCFAVVNVEEAIALRDGGIKKDILVFAPPDPGTSSAYRIHNLTAVVSDAAHFEMLAPGTTYHVEFDTGMGRLGMAPALAGKVKEKIRAFPHLHCGGVMTHFASADIPAQKAKTREQIALFGDIRLSFNDMPGLLFHAANTAGILCFPEAQYDMVRPGLGLYGYDSSLVTESRLKPVLQWKSHVTLCKRIGRGRTVSYGATWTAPVDGYLGVIPVGYADGFKRSLSGKTKVRIQNEFYPVVGRVTMDFIMVFLGDKKVNPGTAVSLLDDQDNNADVWAGLLDTIAFEILCGLHNRVKRVYLQ
ncbi:MAG: alanine racemase [Balneolales bacterium]